MKKKVIAVAAIWSILVSFTACSEKLDETLITQKNMDKLIEKAITDTEGREFLKEVRDSVPEHYEYSYENTDQTLTVNVDADVILPETDEIPMYQTEDGGFSQEQVTALYDYLFEGKETYTVLENGQKKPVDSSLQKTEYGLQLCCETDDGAQISIRAEYSDKGGYSYIDYQDTDMGNLSEQAMEENMDTFISVSLGITQEKARNIAEKLFQNIGIPIKLVNTSLFSDPSQNNGEYSGYVFYFARVIDGVESAVMNSAVTENSNYPYQSRLYEEIKVFVDRNGICRLTWWYPIDVVEKAADNTPVISFDDAKNIFENISPDIFEKKMEDYNEILYSEGFNEHRNFDIDINSVKLSLIHIRSSEDSAKGIYTPAWIFYGTKTDYFDSEDKFTDVQPWIAFAVNAVDGSVIDVTQVF